MNVRHPKIFFTIKIFLMIFSIKNILYDKIDFIFIWQFGLQRNVHSLFLQNSSEYLIFRILKNKVTQKNASPNHIVKYTCRKVVKTESWILSLYGKIRVKENRLFSGIFYAVFVCFKVSYFHMHYFVTMHFKHC